MTSGYIRALTIAGSDSGGGAGIQADLKTFAAMGCYGMSVVTAVTAQNTLGVSAIHAVPPDMVTAQIDAVFTDIGVDATKIGMVGDAPTIDAVADGLRRHDAQRVVVDPVMVAASGDPLLEESAVATLRDVLVPLADVVTPNLPEAELLTGRSLATDAQVRDACRALTDHGAAAVLIKGGHRHGDHARDVLYDAGTGEFEIFDAPRVDTVNTHGTGCTLAAAVAAGLARGAGLREAVAAAKRYLTAALEAGAARRLGGGHGPVHHFHALWPK